MNRTYRKILILAVGSLLTIVGIVGAIPFIPGPGTLLILVGLALLSRESKTARRFDQWLRRKLPRVFAATDRAKDSILDAARRRKGIKDMLSHLLRAAFPGRTPPPAAPPQKPATPKETTALP